MYYNYSNDPPTTATRSLFIGEWQYTVNYHVEQLTPDEEAPHGYAYRYLSVTLRPGVWSYDAIVDALVTAEYPTARMQAVINNYLATPDDAAIRSEFEAMQAWRTEAKRLAREALSLYPTN